jgi:hypothetical protein
MKSVKNPDKPDWFNFVMQIDERSSAEYNNSKASAQRQEIFFVQVIPVS